MGQARKAAEYSESTLPFPSLVPAALVSVLHRWYEWRVVQAAPRPVKMPDPELTYKITGKGIVASRRFVLAHSTAPQEPGRMHEFNLAFLGLSPRERYCVLIYLDLEQEVWQENSPIWRDSLKLLGVTQEQFNAQLVDALMSLAALARQRGVL